MARFDDYHRTIIGYHGTVLSVALKIVNRIENFRKSKRDYDWLGHGVYFWEYSPQQALTFATIRQKQLRQRKIKTEDEKARATEPLAVVASMIRLGFCLDLAEPENVEYIRLAYTEYLKVMKLAGDAIPENKRKFRKLDCNVFEYIYTAIETDPTLRVDSARGIYVPSGNAQLVWPGSWISRETHVQVCVRNPQCILGTWLHYPTNLEVNDVCETIKGTDLKVKPSDQDSHETT